MKPQEMTRNLLQQRPGRGHSHANAADTPNVTDTQDRRYHQETADSYSGVVAMLNATWRVIECRDAVQWIVQRRKSGGAERPWRAAHYCRTRKALLRLCAASCGRIEAKASTDLAALPRGIGGAI